jgi:hypothetical protein
VLFSGPPSMCVCTIRVTATCLLHGTQCHFQQRLTDHNACIGLGAKAYHDHSSPEQLHLESLDSNNVGLAASSRGVPVQKRTWHSRALQSTHVRQHDSWQHDIAA